MNNKHIKEQFKTKKNKGFTLIEVIIAVTIVVILSSLGVPKVVQYIDKAKEAKAVTMAKQLYTAAMWSYTEQGNKFTEDAIKAAITSSTGITATPTVSADNASTIVFSSDGKSYTITLNGSTNSYEVKYGEKSIFTMN